MDVVSPDFVTGSRLADEHTHLLGNVAPNISVSRLPAEARELALVMDDPDAPLPHGCTHWLRYGIPAADGLITSELLPHRHGVNGFGSRGYDGPKPPIGHGVHHYYFWVYALSRPVIGEPDRVKFLTEYAPYILDMNRVVATYSR